MKKILLMYFILLLFQTASASENQQLPVRTVIAGKIMNGRADTLTLSFFSQRLGITTKGARISRNTTTNGDFKLILPEFTGIAYISLLSSVWPRLALSNYLVEPGDSIYITVNPSNLTIRQNIAGTGLAFTGRNPEKFQARYLVDSLSQVLHQQIMAAGPPIRDREPRFDTLVREIDKYLEKTRKIKLHALAVNKEKLSPLSYGIMEADILYQSLLAIITQFSFSWGPVGKYADSLDRIKAMVTSFHDRFENEPERLQTTKEGRENSWAYLDFLTRRTMYSPRLAKGRGITIQASDYLPFIKQLSPGMQEKTSTTIAAYLYTYSPEVRGENVYLDSIITRVFDPFLSGILLNYRSIMRKGAPFFPFSLPDPSGKMINIDTFKGKAVLVDFWFTGCLACIKLAGRMRRVKEILKDNKNIVFMSISADKEKETWLNSLKQDKYTDKENINLFTNGLGFNHPLLNHYSFTAFPKMMVIDPAGRIYSNNPPTPDGEDTIIALATMLKEAALYK